MSAVVLDTDVASAVLKDRLPDRLARELDRRQLAITFVTVGELTQWTHLRRWGPQRRAGLDRFFARIVVLPYSPRVATLWGRDPDPRPAPRTSQTGQRQLDRRLLPGPRAPARHAQHQGLCRLRRARGTPTPPLTIISVERAVEIQFLRTLREDVRRCPC